MKVDPSSQITTKEPKSTNYPSVYKVITAVALTAIALVACAISSQQPRSLAPSFSGRNLAETQHRFSASLCERAIETITNGEHKPKNAWVSQHHGLCVCHVKDPSLPSLFACTDIQDKEKSTLESSGVDLEAAPFQLDVTTHEIKACFDIRTTTSNLRANT